MFLILKFLRNRHLENGCGAHRNDSQRARQASALRLWAKNNS